MLQRREQRLPQVSRTVVTQQVVRLEALVGRRRHRRRHGLHPRVLKRNEPGRPQQAVDERLRYPVEQERRRRLLRQARHLLQQLGDRADPGDTTAARRVLRLPARREDEGHAVEAVQGWANEARKPTGPLTAPAAVTAASAPGITSTYVNRVVS